MARGGIPSWSFDLLDFIQEAANYGITSSMDLTDVFFGFEIWEGAAVGDLPVDSFSIQVE